MKVALFKGKSPISLAIRWFTRSQWSHAAIVFDEASEAAGIQMVKSGCEFKRLHFFSNGSVVEAWRGGVKNSLSISSLHHSGTPVQIMSLCDPNHQTDWPLSRAQEERCLHLCDESIGTEYDYRDILAFLFRLHGHPAGSIFCSFLVFRLMSRLDRTPLQRTEGWRVPPDWLWRTPFLKPFKEVITR